MKKRDFRDEVKRALPDVLNAVFEQGMAHQALAQASGEAQVADQAASQELTKFYALIDTPEKKEIN